MFGTKFGFRVEGITLRKDKEGNPYILLFHSAKRPYPDQDLANEFTYIGEGLKGDQKLTAANKALIDAITDKRQIFGFWQEKIAGKYEYIGKLAVKSYSYELMDGRKVYKFKIWIGEYGC